MRTYTGDYGRRRGRSILVALGILVGGSLVAVGGSTAATVGGAPTISGTPIEGATLTANGPPDTSLYKWERCDPSLFACVGGDSSAALASDPGYAPIPDARAQTYTLTSADVGYFVRVLVKATSLGTQWVPSEPVGPVLAAPSPPPQQQQAIVPVHGVQLLGVTTEGTVRFKAPGASGFSPVIGTTVIPVGSIIDARKGTILLTAATGDFGNRDPDNGMEFFDGMFKIKQGAATDAPALAKLVGKLRCGGKKKGVAAAAGGGPIAKAAARRRGLWGRGRGRYGTRGRGGTGSVVGTTWFTKDTCDGTFWKVTDGAGISVDPKGKKKDVFLGPGDDYFAEG